MKKFWRGPGLFLILFVVIIALVQLFSAPLSTPGETIDYKTFLERVKEGQVSAISVQSTTVYGLKTDSSILQDDFPTRYDFTFEAPTPLSKLYEDVASIVAVEKGVAVDTVSSLDYPFDLVIEPPEKESWIVAWLPTLLVVVMLGLFWFFIARQQMGGNNKVISFGKSKAKPAEAGKKKITFADVEGAKEEKEELQELVEFLKKPQRFLDLGARIPKGVLLVGPPGTGKTLLAKAIAGEAGVPFFSISGSDFVEMFVGVGASRVRDLFNEAKKNSPSIIFIDEIDAVGRHRGAGLGGGHDEREQTLNQLLVEMDGFAPNEGIIVIAATNRPDILDPALLRPGRFDRQVTVNYPDVQGREQILKLHCKGKPLGEDVDLGVLARRTPYFTGADLENVMNEAALLAARRHKRVINMPEVEEAITRVIVGTEKRSRVMTEKDKKLVAYHEAGHAVAAYFLPNCDDVHEVSIIPRGRAGGYTMTLPNEEVNFTTRAQLVDRVAEALGGHVAEMIVFGDVTTGSTSDLKHATEIVRAMVTEYGMCPEIGRIYLGGDQEVFIGKDFGHTRSYSEDLAARIDAEISDLLESQFTRVEELLTAHRKELDALVDALLEREKLDDQEFKTVMEGKPLPEKPQPSSAAEPKPEEGEAEAEPKGTEQTETPQGTSPINQQNPDTGNGIQ